MIPTDTIIATAVASAPTSTDVRLSEAARLREASIASTPKSLPSAPAAMHAAIVPTPGHTVTTQVLKVQDSKTGHLLPGITPSTGLTIIFAGLIGGILWNLLTWLFGIPSSSSHALFGGLIGAGLAALGSKGVNWTGISQKVLIPAVAAPVIAGIVAAAGTWLVYRITRKVMKKRREDGFRWGQIATASLVALSHGTNDAQKTMGVIALALITTGHLTGNVAKNGLPIWIVFSCAVAIGLGTYIGGWRVIRTLGKGLVEIESPQGFAAEASSAAIILSSSAAGMALSTTHVATGSILGSGVGKPGVRFGQRPDPVQDTRPA